MVDAAAAASSCIPEDVLDPGLKVGTSLREPVPLLGSVPVEKITRAWVNVANNVDGRGRGRGEASSASGAR